MTGHERDHLQVLSLTAECISALTLDGTSITLLPTGG